MHHFHQKCQSRAIFPRPERALEQPPATAATENQTLPLVLLIVTHDTFGLAPSTGSFVGGVSTTRQHSIRLLPNPAPSCNRTRSCPIASKTQPKRSQKMPPSSLSDSS